MDERVLMQGFVVNGCIFKCTIYVYLCFVVQSTILLRAKMKDNHITLPE
jgi:hypothetical protein